MTSHKFRMFFFVSANVIRVIHHFLGNVLLLFYSDNQKRKKTKFLDFFFFVILKFKLSYELYCNRDECVFCSTISLMKYVYFSPSLPDRDT